MNKNEKMERKLTELLTRDNAMEPQRIELGGGIYYRCPWMMCNEDVNRFMNFCPGCGQRLDWRFI